MIVDDMVIDDNIWIPSAPPDNFLASSSIHSAHASSYILDNNLGSIPFLQNLYAWTAIMKGWISVSAAKQKNISLLTFLALMLTQLGTWSIGLIGKLT